MKCIGLSLVHLYQSYKEAYPALERRMQAAVEQSENDAHAILSLQTDIKEQKDAIQQVQASLWDAQQVSATLQREKVTPSVAVSRTDRVN